MSDCRRHRRPARTRAVHRGTRRGDRDGAGGEVAAGGGDVFAGIYHEETGVVKPTNRKRITLTGTTLDLIMTMSEGNPGAVTALGALMKDDDMALMRILDLDDMGMRGSQIWVAFKEHCKCDVEVFRKALLD